MSVITDTKQMETYSTPEQIAEAVYEAATDGKDQLRYVAGADGKATYAMRLQMGDEASVRRSISSFSDNSRSLHRAALGRFLPCADKKSQKLIFRS